MRKIIKNLMKVFGFIDYSANDPKVPIIIKKQIPDLPKPCPSFAVQGFTGQSGVPHSLQWQAAGLYSMLVNSLSFLQKSLTSPLTRWARTSRLVVLPRAGKQLNAYYDGGSLKFFYDKSKTPSDYVFTCESSDIVSHELGHAILDAIRPDLWSVQAIEVFAFHESFGDMNAILASLQYNEILDYLLSETNGNLRSSNIVSELAEELGSAIYANRKDSLRNAINNFHYVIPERLPNNAPDEQLSRESHNFSRVFTGAFYEMLVLQFELNCKTLPQKQALIQARDEVGFVLYNALPRAAVTTRFYDAMARAMLSIDSKCKDSIAKAFSERGIIRPTPLLVESQSVEMKDENAIIYESRDIKTVRCGGTRTVRLVDELILPMSENPLYGVEVEIPNEHYVEYEMGFTTVNRPVESQELLSDVKSCLDFLHATDKVEHKDLIDSNKEFFVVNGKLERNLICCKKC